MIDYDGRMTPAGDGCTVHGRGTDRDLHTHPAIIVISCTLVKRSLDGTIAEEK
jgi:hypothetical protein